MDLEFTKPGTVRPRFLPYHDRRRLPYIVINCPVVGKTIWLRQKSQQTHYYYRIATKLAKAYQHLLLQFQ